MKPVNGTLKVLTEIREEIRGTNERVDALRNELSQRIVDSEVRTSTAIAELAGTVREMTSVLRVANDLRPRLERCEHDIEDIKRRVG